MKTVITVGDLSRDEADKQTIEYINKKYNKEKMTKPNLLRNIKWNKEKQEVYISFGKNGNGLTSEFKQINEIVERMSKKAYVYIENTFIDSLDDVYDITLKYIYKNDESNKDR